MSTKLWAGAGTVFVGVFTMKQMMWQKVSHEVRSIRDADNDKNFAVLSEVHEKSREYSLKPLTDKQKQKLKDSIMVDGTVYQMNKSNGNENSAIQKTSSQISNTSTGCSCSD